MDIETITFESGQLDSTVCIVSANNLSKTYTGIVKLQVVYMGCYLRK